MSEYKKWELTLALSAVKAAGDILGTTSPDSLNLTSRTGREWKISTDRELESIIINHLREGSNYPILSEEMGLLDGKGDRWWIVDPLDGSVNFFLGIPMYCISVGLWEHARPVLGVVLDPHNGQLFTGAEGIGANCNGDGIWVDKIDSPKPFDSVLCTGLSVGLNHSNQEISKVIELCKKFGKVRMLGSAALMLCYVASGRCASYWEDKIGLWDVAAGLAIVSAAGGVINVGKIGVDYRVDVEAACTNSLLACRVCGG